MASTYRYWPPILRSIGFSKKFSFTYWGQQGHVLYLLPQIPEHFSLVVRHELVVNFY